MLPSGLKVTGAVSVPGQVHLVLDFLPPGLDPKSILKDAAHLR